MKTDTLTAKLAYLILLILVGLALFLPRIQALGTYATADEPQYLKKAASFYYLLKEGRFSETDLIVHPGVTSLWSGAIAFWWQFPEYADSNLASYPIADGTFDKLLTKNGVQAYQMLAASRAVSIAIQCAMLLLAFHFGQQAFGLWGALLGILLVGLDPYYFANSRILQPDGMLAASLLLSLVACLSYLKTRSRFALVASAAAASLAFLSKVPGLSVVPIIGVSFFAEWWWGDRLERRTFRDFNLLFRDLMIWILVAVLVFFALWPVMWVDPLRAIGDLLHFTLASSGEVNSPMFFNGKVLPTGEFGPQYFYYYPLTFLWRTTPVVFLGFCLGLLLLLRKPKQTPQDSRLRPHMLVFLLSALFILGMFTLSAKKFDRYLLTALPLLDMFAAFGFIALFDRLKPRLFVWSYNTTRVLTLLVFLMAQAGLVLQVSPYYHLYYNPLMGGVEIAPQVMMVGWGEGLDQAARYLNQKPDVRSLVIYSWHAANFSMFSEAQALDLPISAQISDELFDQILEADYVVTYINQWQRNSSARLLDYLANKIPEKTIRINGLDVARIYNMAETAGQ